VGRRDAISGLQTREPLLRLAGITKLFGDFQAIDNLSLDVMRGEIFALLGPSGCGKSTTLRQIAGFDQPDSGTITLGPRTLFSAAEGTFVPAQKRNMGMVFQSHAIWPHLTVFENVAYPLQLRGIASAEIRTRACDVIRQVGLEGMEDRASTTLSGGQQQRVALARALVYRPEVLLLDEPFSSLDVKLREQMRVELKLLHRQVGVTVILVTHDQSEALSLADRIAVMNRGKVEQVAACAELYDNPATPFVRDFIGQINKLPVTIVGVGGAGEVAVAAANGATLTSTHSKLPAGASGACLACIRPEAIMIGERIDANANNIIEAKVEALLFAGDRYECLLDFAGTKISAVASRGQHLAEGQTIRLQLPKQALTLWAT
jgi:ABC-type Fe3+/spermidine/putrescine transport system ATPase subunit